MEYQKAINLLYNAPYQPSKFRTKIWVKINDNACGTHNTNGQIIKLQSQNGQTSILKSSLCDFRDPYIFAKWTISVTAQ